MSYQIACSRATPPNIDQKQNIRDKILIIKQRLIDLGYNPGEVDYLVQKLGKGKSLDELGITKLNELKQALETQLDIAKKCLDAV